MKQCSIPPLFQDAVIRSALALKLHCFEDTGAIVAAMTTSIPESPGSGRTWDYRYCWLRDAYYALGAFRLLGQFRRTRELHPLSTQRCRRHAGPESLAFVLRGRRTWPEERILESWPGFAATGRFVSAMAPHSTCKMTCSAKWCSRWSLSIAMIATAPIAPKPHCSCLQGLARKAISVAGQPDAGIWEYRTEWKPQTFSSLMCWAAADRMARVAARHAPSLEQEFREASQHIHEQIMAEAWRADLGKLSSPLTAAGDLDASLLQMSHLRFLPLNDTRLCGTIDAIREGLSRNGWLLRYRLDDGFGSPTAAFVICTFWLIEALADIGRKDEAKKIMDRVYSTLSPLGLLSEDYSTSDLRMWGNFPQAYSHVGLIRAAFAASPSWADVM